MNIKSNSDSDYIKIYFDDVLHIKIEKIEIVGIQSYKHKGKYYIEYSFKSGVVIESEYDNIEKWEVILKILDKII